MDTTQTRRYTRTDNVFAKYVYMLNRLLVGEQDRLDELNTQALC